MLAVSSAEWTGAGGFPALSAPQLGQHFDERAVAMVPDQQTHRIDRLSAMAMQFQAAVRPVG
jgi:hypothetical protein